MALLTARQITWAQPPAERLVPSEVERLDAATETIDGAFPGLLVVPRGDQLDKDDKYSQPYHAVCCGYIAERASGSNKVIGYARRFYVHAPDADALPLAKRVARELLLLLAENRERLRYDPPRDNPTVDVWLTRQNGQGLSADVGGEQFKNKIYIYGITSDRRPIEWMREVAHEYGHYALPGVSGFHAPEEWANGVLGERLFLKWLADDLRAGRLRPEDLPFVTPEQLNDYIARQVTPLIRRIAHDGVDAHLVARRDAAGMDYYTGFALYLDAVYSSNGLLDALSFTTPRTGGVFIEAPDFLRGAYGSLRDATEFTLTPPFPMKAGASEGFLVYLPRGDFLITTDGPVRSWQFSTDTKGIHPVGKTGLIVNIPGWSKLTITTSQAAGAPRLMLRRRSAQVE
jgi:hypothetical protein